VGVTNNIIRRVFEHKHKLVEGFSKQYELGTLVYLEQFVNINDSISAEKRIKGWSRAKKIALIETKNPDWIDLDSSHGSE
jgi:putative endonuclease